MLARISLLAISTLALVGCNTVRGPIEGRADPFVSPQVTFASKDLAKSTAVGVPNLQRDDAGNLLHVTLPIRSAINKTLYVDYKVSFLDAGGGLISETGWMTKTLEANTPSSITVNSTSERAADFHVALRWAR
jgi:hypothetical protein